MTLKLSPSDWEKIHHCFHTNSIKSDVLTTTLVLIKTHCLIKVSAVCAFSGFITFNQKGYIAAFLVLLIHLCPIKQIKK